MGTFLVFIKLIEKALEETLIPAMFFFAATSLYANDKDVTLTTRLLTLVILLCS